MISLRLNGEAFDNFISISVSNSLQSLSGKFSFTATEDNTATFPFAAGDRVQVLLQELDFLVGIANGFIDSISINYSKNSHTLRITGRDKTEDIIDSQIKDIELKVPFELTDVIKAVFNFLGITDIKIIDLTGKIDPFKIDPFKLGEAGSVKQGESGFAFINKYAELRQVLVSNVGDGNIILTRVDNPLRNGEILNLKGNDIANNVKSAHVVYDHSQRFNEYVVISQFNPSTEAVDFSGNPTGTIPASEVPKAVNHLGKAQIDPDIRTTRKLVLVPPKGMSVDIATKRAKWENALRIARTKKYHVTVQGFVSNDGLIWQTGQLVRVRDQFASIDGELIVSEIKYNFSLHQGSTTTLTLVKQDVYQA